MRKLALLIIILTLALSACAAPASQATEPAVLPVTGTEEVPAATAEITTGPAAETAASPAVDATLATSAEVTPEVTETTTSAQTAIPQPGTASGVVTYSLVPEESTVTYEVGETFINQGNVFNVAVGKTQGVTGDIQVDFDQPQNTTLGPLVVDISGFSSDSARRDGAIRDRFLQSSQYPTVTFTPTTVEGLPESVQPGVDYPITLRGDLNVRDTTQPAAFDAQVRLQDDGALVGQAVTTILMSEYGFGPIDILGMLKTEDQVKITVDFVARPQ